MRRRLEPGLVEVRASPIHGLGVFAARPIARNALVTYYDGERVSWDEAKARAAWVRASCTHMRSVAFGHEAIDGLRAPLPGRGVGSLCNHARPANAAYWTRDDVVWIKAARDIECGEEVLVDYGRTYWARHAPE